MYVHVGYGLYNRSDLVYFFSFALPFQQPIATSQLTPLKASGLEHIQTMTGPIATEDRDHFMTVTYWTSSSILVTIPIL